MPEITIKDLNRAAKEFYLTKEKYEAAEKNWKKLIHEVDESTRHEYYYQHEYHYQ